MNHLVAILDGDIFEIDGVLGAVLEAIFYNINGIELGIAQIDGILVDVTDELGSNLGAAARAARKGCNDNDDDNRLLQCDGIFHNCHL